jgi:hypothetical protein
MHGYSASSSGIFPCANSSSRHVCVQTGVVKQAGQLSIAAAR